MYTLGPTYGAEANEDMNTNLMMNSNYIFEHCAEI